MREFIGRLQKYDLLKDNDWEHLEAECKMAVDADHDKRYRDPPGMLEKCVPFFSSPLLFLEKLSSISR